MVITLVAIAVTSVIFSFWARTPKCFQNYDMHEGAPTRAPKAHDKITVAIVKCINRASFPPGKARSVSLAWRCAVNGSDFSAFADLIAEMTGNVAPNFHSKIIAAVAT